MTSHFRSGPSFGLSAEVKSKVRICLSSSLLFPLFAFYRSWVEGARTQLTRATSADTSGSVLLPIHQSYSYLCPTIMLPHNVMWRCLCIPYDTDAKTGYSLCVKLICTRRVALGSSRYGTIHVWNLWLKTKGTTDRVTVMHMCIHMM